MKISFYTVKSNLKTDNGYGYAGSNVRNSLERLGHSVAFHDPAAKIQIDFCQPDLYNHFDHQYKIGYTPWESSQLPEGWLEKLNSVDEVWTTSQKCKEWYLKAKVKKPIHVFEHGIEEIWSPKLRKPKKKLKFLHVGEPAPRKGGQAAFEAFLLAFGNSEDVHLTIKANGHSTIRAYALHFHRGGPRSILGLPHQVYKNISLQDAKLSLEELVELYHEHDVLVYPSWGEGFGLIPLQALATGMPTICTGEWAPYERFLGGLSLNSKKRQSKWPDMHPGNMYEPDLYHLVELYKMCLKDYDSLSQTFFDNADKVHSEYNWDKLTENAFKHLENI